MHLRLFLRENGGCWGKATQNPTQTVVRSSPQEAARVPQVVFCVGPRQANHSPRHLPGDNDTAEPRSETAVR
jgi:hypothetical protein